MAPSGALLIGAALALRDSLQERAGRGAVVAAILAGGTVSWAAAPAALAAASVAAFLLSETIDFASYTWLRERSRALAILVSGVFGAAADSALFNWLAFGAVAWAPGLFLAKMYASILYALWVKISSLRA